MRVLLVCHGYPPRGVAGVERLSEQTAGELTARGHEVTVLTREPAPAPKVPSLRRDVRAGLEVITVLGGGASSLDDFPGAMPVLERIFERLLFELEPDVVLMSHLLHHSPGYVAVAQRWRIPVVLELHDFFLLCPLIHLRRTSGELCDGPEAGLACAGHCFAGQDDAELRWTLRSQSFAEALDRAERVIAPSPFVVERFGPMRDPGRPIGVVPNAVADFGPSLRTAPPGGEPTLRLATIGVTVEHKGMQVVVEALRLARLPAVSYTVFGVALPPLSHRLLADAAQIDGLDFKLAGGFHPGLLPILLGDVDVAIVPSIVPETYSIVAREARACGVPVIASRIGALAEAVEDGVDGWLFAPDNAPELAVLLQRIDRDRALLRDVAERSAPAARITVGARTDRVEAELQAAVAAAGEQRWGEPPSEAALMREALAAGG